MTISTVCLRPIGLLLALGVACSACSRTLHGGLNPPTGVTAVAVGSGRVELSWTGVSGATSYDLYLASQSGVKKGNYATLPDGARQQQIPASPYAQTGLTDGKTYYFVVTAVNSGGESVESAEASATPALVSAELPIATNPDTVANVDHQESVSAASDGTNFLVGIGDIITPAGGSPSSYVSAQLVSGTTGALIGSRIAVGRLGEDPFVAFDGTNYFMVWEDDTTFASDSLDHIYGQFVSTSGQLVGSPFPVSPAQGFQGLSGLNALVFDGSNYFVIWDGAATGDGCIDQWGQFVTPAGALLGAPIKINANVSCDGYGEHSLAFGAGRILVIWASSWDASGAQPLCWDDNTGHHCAKDNVWGQFVSKSSAGAAGSLAGSNLWLLAGAGEDHPPTIAFDGTNYLLVYPEETTPPNACPAGGCQWDVYAQLVTPAGALAGARIAIANTSWLGMPAWNGTNYLVTWPEGIGTTAMMTKGVLLDAAGNRVGSELTLFAPSDDGRVPWMVVPVGDGDKYFAVVDRGKPGADPTDFHSFTNANVYGAFITP